MDVGRSDNRPDLLISNDPLSVQDKGFWDAINAKVDGDGPLQITDMIEISPVLFEIVARIIFPVL